MKHAVCSGYQLPDVCQLIHMCFAGVFDSDVTASYYSGYHMRLPVCVSILLSYFQSYYMQITMYV